MYSVAMDLDFLKLFSLDTDEMKKELIELKNIDVEILVIPYEIFQNKELQKFRNKLLEALSEVKFTIYLKASSVRKYYTTYTSDKELLESIVVHKQFIFNVYKTLKGYGLTDGLKVIYESGICKNSNIAMYLDKAITFYRELSSAVDVLKVSVMAELLQTDVSIGRRIGDRWQDLETLCQNIENDNFGICWNMKNSRINSLEFNDRLIPSKNVIDKVMLATVTNTHAYSEDRRPFNVEMQAEELKALIREGKDAPVHLEYIYSYIQELDIPYQNVYDSVRYLRYMLTYFVNEKRKGRLVINYDLDKLKRRFIRRRFTSDSLAVVVGNSYKFRDIELSENDVRLISDMQLKLEADKDYKVLLKIANNSVELDTKLVIVRSTEMNVDYIFKIENKDRFTLNKICEMIYLTE